MHSPTIHPCEPPDDAVAGLCVLASGSRGNCSVLVVPEGGTRRVVLIDAGLSPRRTRRMLDDLGIDLWEIDAIVLTHLDADHAHLGWAALERLKAPFFVHAAHRGRAERSGLCVRRTTVFRDSFRIGTSLEIQPELLEHDALGVVVFRMIVERGREQAVLSYATDVGRPSEALARHIADADTLAIESNYCPDMQRASGRPVYLQRRIMGGAGHLSNEQCLELVRAASPRGEVVCLHLSQQCNNAELVRALHADAPYRLTVTSQHRRSDWVWLRPSARRGSKPDPAPVELPLWAGEAGA